MRDHKLCCRAGLLMEGLVPVCGMWMSVPAAHTLPVQSTHLSNVSTCQGRSTVEHVLTVFCHTSSMCDSEL
jgi:hypothetical protein